MKALGKIPYEQALERIEKSGNYYKGAFRNQERVPPDLRMSHPAKIAYDFFTVKRIVEPQQPVLAVKTDLRAIVAEQPTITWFGHSSYLIRYKNLNILVDPVLCGYASPFYIMTKAFEGADIYTPEDMPDIDYLLITHDHFDHLDYASILRLNTRVKAVITPLGVGSHLKYWGYNDKIITELDWEDELQPAPGLQIRSVTTRHNSGRTLIRNKTLWTSYILQLDQYRLFLCADGGYGQHFKKIGQQYGPFDFAVMENGQYNTSWPLNHMFPEQSVEAAADLQAQLIMPIHWGKFAIAHHTWNEPIHRFTAAARKNSRPYTVPQIGQPYNITDPPLTTVWWDFD